jgi:TRAP-type C4-dicarboxylate transport system substrate-binding protein
MKFSTKGLIAAAAIAMCASSSAATWTAYTFGPAESLGNVQGLKRILSDIEKSTDGEIKFRLRLAGSLPIQATNITQAVGNGSVLFADDGFYLGNIRVAGVLRLPMLLRTEQDYATAFKIMEPYINREFEKKGVVVLGHFLFPHQVAFSAKPLTKLSEMKDQKLRVSSPEQAAFVERMGGIPVTLGGAEVPSGLQTGTVDGVFTASAGGGKIWGDMLKYNYRLPVNYFDGFYLVNKKAFDKLSPATQQKLRDSVQRLAPATTAQIFKEESEVTTMLKDKGMVITQPSAADEAEATRKVADYWDAWAKEQGGEVVPTINHGNLRRAFRPAFAFAHRPRHDRAALAFRSHDRRDVPDDFCRSDLPQRVQFLAADSR